jgi:hypothetical protein
VNLPKTQKNIIMKPLATLNSGYILNQSEPLLAIALRKSEEFTDSFIEKEEYNEFTVYLKRSKQFDTERYQKWIDLIKAHYNIS